MTLRVLTYNIEFGEKERADRVLGVLQAANADIISLTEADDPDVAAYLAGKLEMSHVWERGSGNRHIATLSRFEITESHIHNRPPLTQAVLETVHRLPGGPLRQFNIHFLPYLLLPFEFRRWQAVGKLLEVIRSRTAGPHLLIGDINAVGPGDRVLHGRNPARMRRVMALQLFVVFRLAIPRLLRGGYTDCFRSENPGADGFTWRTGNPTTRYDYILADPLMAARLQGCRVLDDLPGVMQASDHYPLMADFEIERQ